MSTPRNAPLSHYIGRKPSALKWLEDRHAHLAGEIAQLEADLVAGRRRLRQARRELQAVDTALEMPDVGVDPSGVPPVRPQRVKRVLPHGALTRHLLTLLRKAKRPVSTDIAACAIVTAERLELSPAEQVVFRDLVRYRLKNLAKAGRVTRLRGRGPSNTTCWAARR